MVVLFITKDETANSLTKLFSSILPVTTTAPNFNVNFKVECVMLDFRTDNFEVDNDLITM